MSATREVKLSEAEVRRQAADKSVRDLRDPRHPGLGKGEWTSHDLRKVSRTTWTDLGIDGHIGEMLLNHTLGKIASTYIHTQAMQQRRAALEKWHAWLDGIGFGAIHGLTKALSEISQNSGEPAEHKASSHLAEFVISEDSK